MTGFTLPEIGPYLGRLTDVTRRFEDPAVGLDSIRLTLVSTLFERAQAARSFLAVGDTAGARGSLDRASWLALWQDAASRAAERTTVVIRDRFDRARRESRCPPRVARRYAPTAEDGEILATKFEAAGIALEERTARPAASDQGWWDQIRQAAVALDDAWEDLEDLVRRELLAAAERARPVAAWRPSPIPRIVAGTGAVALAGWLGLALGGFLPRPGWLDGLHRVFWSLPWP